MDKILLIVGGYFGLKYLAGVDLLEGILGPSPTPNTPVNPGSTQPGGASPVTTTPTQNPSGGSNNSTTTPVANTLDQAIALVLQGITNEGLPGDVQLNIDQWNHFMGVYGGWRNLPSPEALGVDPRDRLFNLNGYRYKLIDGMGAGVGMGAVPVIEMNSPGWGRDGALFSEQVRIRSGRRVV